MINTLEIRRLNDALRRSLTGGGGRVFLTGGIDALPSSDQAAILIRVSEYADFSEGNDPHGEHDFGALDHNGHRIFWKIDYYGLTMDCGSEDPADTSKTTRVLTIMLASEY